MSIFHIYKMNSYNLEIILSFNIFTSHYSKPNLFSRINPSSLHQNQILNQNTL